MTMRTDLMKSFLLAIAMALPLFSMSSSAYSAQERYFQGRSYSIIFPTKKPGKKKYPMVLMLHGGLGNAFHLERVLPFEAMAKKHGLVLVFPNGYPLRLAPRRKVWNAGGCCGRAAFDNIDDVGYLSDLIKKLVKRYPINKRQIYMMGHSNGGMMAYRFACERPGVLAGIIPIAGPLMTESCKSGPVRVLHIHGDQDTRVPFEGRRRIRVLVQSRPFRSVRATKRIVKKSGAQFRLLLVRGAGHMLYDIDEVVRERHSIGVPGIIARFVKGPRPVKSIK